MSVLEEAKRTYMRGSDRRAQILACARELLAAAAPAPPTEAVAAASRHQGLMEID